MPDQSSNTNTFALASRFLHAFQTLSKMLASSSVSSSVDQLNVSQIRILQVVHDDPGIRADAVIERLDLNADTARSLILAMEKTGLVALDRSMEALSPGLRLGVHGNRLAFQIKATQLVAVAELLGRLPEAEQLAAVKVLEQITAQPDA